MLNSISYLEISCKYNKVDLKQFAGDLIDNSASRSFMYRNRKYVFSYVEDEDEFRIFNSRGVLMAVIVGDSFQFYIASAPEIGLNLVWGLLAKLNVYPVKSF